MDCCRHPGVAAEKAVNTGHRDLPNQPVCEECIEGFYSFVSNRSAVDELLVPIGDNND